MRGDRWILPFAIVGLVLAGAIAAINERQPAIAALTLIMAGLIYWSKDWRA